MGRPLAYVLLGAGDQEEVGGGNNVTDYTTWAKEVGPRLEACGIVRVILHNPGGQYNIIDSEDGDTRDMRIDQWLIAERLRLPFANRFDFRTAVGILESHGVTEVIVYVGSPTQLLAENVERDLPLCLEPFMGCGGICSFAFDAMFEDGFASPYNDDQWEDLWAVGGPYRAAIARLRRDHLIYAEARLHAPQLAAGLGDLVDGTIADNSFDEANPGYDLSLQPGETIRVTDVATEVEWDADPWWPEADEWLEVNVTPAYASDLNWGDLLDADLPPPQDFIDQNAEE